MHEFCYVYAIDDGYTKPVPPDFVEVSAENLDSYLVKPAPLAGLIKDRAEEFRHFVNDEIRTGS